jgi:uncharacterized RmlC-like cupin family protein
VTNAAENVHVVRASEPAAGRQGLVYGHAISAESVGAHGLCMHLGTIPPGAVGEAHLHEGHETAIYVLEGRARMRYGAELEHEIEAGTGDFVYIGAGVPHRPMNASETEPVRFVAARTDPRDEESVVVLPAPFGPRKP